MSGAIVIEGMGRYVSEVRDLREQIFVLRGQTISLNPQAASLLERVEVPSNRCDSDSGVPEEIFTVNGAIRPHIAIAPGERQFWRFVNASADRYVDLQLDGQRFEIVALDGMPIAYHDPEHPTRTVNQFLIPPAGRASSQGRRSTSRREIRTRFRCHFHRGQEGLLHQRTVIQTRLCAHACGARGDLRALAHRQRDGRTPSHAYSPGAFSGI